MKEIIDFLKLYGVKGLIVLIVGVIFAFLVALLPSCSIAKSGISGDRVVDKNVKDSVHYELILEK